MALRDLSVGEMISVSLGWISREDPARAAIEAQPQLSGLLPALEQAHAAIFAVAPKPDDPRRAEIVRSTSEVDARHDRLASAIYGFLSELARFDEQGSALLSLRDTLYPDGLASVVQSSYRQQAGYAKLLRDRITPAVRAQLEAIPLLKGTLLERVDAWLDAADELGRLEQERARIETTLAPSTAQQVLEARYGWIRAVSAFESVAALVQLDADTDRLLFGPLRDALAKAEQRGSRRKPAAVESEREVEAPSEELLPA